MQCCVSPSLTLSPYLSFFSLSFSVSLSQVSISLTCTRTHTHLSFLLCSFSSSSLSYPLKGHCLSFCSFMEVLGYFEGVQVLDHISGSWKTLIVFLRLPCDCLKSLPAITELMVYCPTLMCMYSRINETTMGWKLVLRYDTIVRCILSQYVMRIYVHSWACFKTTAKV